MCICVSESREKNNFEYDHILIWDKFGVFVYHEMKFDVHPNMNIEI